MHTMNFNVLPKQQQEIYPYLSFAKDYGFILFGGTAIALQIKHRISIDFDFFKQESLSTKDKEKILQKLPSDKIIQDDIDTLVYIKNGVKISFFGNIDFALPKNSLMIDDVLMLANLDTLLATKLKTTFDRAEYKDYKDIAEILKQGTDLSLAIKKMNEFYPNSFSSSQILKNLTYFNDGDLHRLSLNDKKILINQAKKLTNLSKNQELYR